MSLVLEGYTLAQQYLCSWLHSISKTENPLKVGVLSSAAINVAAIIKPVETHPDVILHAIASRDASKAASLASEHQFHKSYGSYEGLLADSEVDFIYISLPNSLHFEWAYKSLEAGKHVLLERPFTSNGKEAEALVNKSKESGKIIMEALHWQFHPAAHQFRAILDSGEFGKIIGTSAAISSTPPIPPNDLCWQYDLAGGSLMSMSYVLSFTRYALHAKTSAVVLHAKAVATEQDPRVDSSMQATMRFTIPNADAPSGCTDVYSTIFTDMARSSAYGVIPRVWELPSIRVETEEAEVYFYNATLPHVYHYIAITKKSTGKTHYVKAYKGGPLWKDRGEAYWSTYRYQLEAFVDKLRGRTPVCWVDVEDSVAQMVTIDDIYRESGLPSRPTISMVG